MKPEPEEFDDLISRLTWQAMSEIVNGTKLKSVVYGIVTQAIQWRREMDEWQAEQRRLDEPN